MTLTYQEFTDNMIALDLRVDIQPKNNLYVVNEDKEIIASVSIHHQFIFDNLYLAFNQLREPMKVAVYKNLFALAETSIEARESAPRYRVKLPSGHYMRGWGTDEHPIAWVEAIWSQKYTKQQVMDIDPAYLPFLEDVSS